MTINVHVEPPLVAESGEKDRLTKRRRLLEDLVVLSVRQSDVVDSSDVRRSPKLLHTCYEALVSIRFCMVYRVASLYATNPRDEITPSNTRSISRWSCAPISAAASQTIGIYSACLLFPPVPESSLSPGGSWSAPDTVMAASLETVKMR
ncbi:hypothetical protein KC329_g75 [Hortaea werneckii]|nr:hypothetical protein KC329_g75 [Hortaea werneckii]